MRLLLLSLLVACDGAAPTPPAEGARPGQLSPGAFQDLGAAQAPTSGQAPAPAPGMASKPTGPTVEGTVVEGLSAPPYSYVRVQTVEGELWAASGGAAPPVGSRVALTLSLPMRDFHSDTLNRDFPLVYFVESLSAPGDGATPAAGAPVGEAAPASIPAPTAPRAGGPVQTIASVWSDRQALAGKTVTVRGKVVKYTPGVMGRNWLHIQDGTGASGTNDLTVTTQSAAAMGVEVEAQGLVKVDEDYGSGYSYPVIVTEAVLFPVTAKP